MGEEEGREKTVNCEVLRIKEVGVRQWFWTFPFMEEETFALKGCGRPAFLGQWVCVGVVCMRYTPCVCLSQGESRVLRGAVTCSGFKSGCRWPQVCSELLFCVLSSSKALALVVRVSSCRAKAEMLAPSGGNSRFLIGVICCLREIFAVGLKKVGLWRCGFLR